MPDNPTSKDVIEGHRAWLRGRIESLEAGARSAQEGMRVDGDHRPASRGERGAVSERGAMRAGLLMRVAALKDSLGELEAIPVRDGHARVVAGAVFQVDDGDDSWWMAILPGGQGVEVAVRGVAVRVISPQAPMARALLGLESDDIAELQLPGRDLELEIISLA